ncbi:MAG TPA: PIG-L family deacetylase, partial [Terriglobales bacterium]|nr:PIG-L family deacetylase [Terriglobales bacterium]
MLRLKEQFPDCTFDWVVFSASGVRESEARRGAELFAGKNARNVTLKNFRDGFMPFAGADV